MAGYTSVGLRQTPNLETIASLHPDLIIADATRHANIYHQLQAIAPTIALDSLQEAYLPNLHAAIVVGQAINKCGLMTRRVQQDKVVMSRLAAAVKQATKSTGGEQRKAMFVVTTNTLWNVHSDLAYTPSLLEAIGIPARNPRSQLDERRQPVHRHVRGGCPLEQPGHHVRREADAHRDAFDKWSTDQLFPNLKAVQARQVYQVNTNLWSKARGILAGEKIAQQAVHLLYHKYVSIALPAVTGTT